jgi:hypothetical protein
MRYKPKRKRHPSRVLSERLRIERDANRIERIKKLGKLEKAARQTDGVDPEYAALYGVGPRNRLHGVAPFVTPVVPVVPNPENVPSFCTHETANSKVWSQRNEHAPSNLGTGEHVE